MMKYAVVASMSLALSASALSAQGGGLQSSPCPQGTTNALGIPDQARAAQDACTQAYDVYQFLAPQLGLLLTGGNATLGQGGTLNGIGHFTVGLRGNVSSGLLPDIGAFSPTGTGAQRRELPTNSQVFAFPTADAAIGIFNGLPLAVSYVACLDVLVSAAFVRSFVGEIPVTPSSHWQFGYGARLGLLQETLVVPGISATYLVRKLPETNIVGTSGADTLRVLNAKVNTTAWRVVASKSLISFGIAAGIGQDTYDQSADIQGVVHTTVNGIPVSGSSTVPNTKQSLTRTNYFLDLSLNLPVFKLIGEVGQATGGKVQTYNSFAGGAADRSQVYGSLGVRLAW
jgi:hypothetical protein